MGGTKRLLELREQYHQDAMAGESFKDFVELKERKHNDTTQSSSAQATYTTSSTQAQLDHCVRHPEEYVRNTRLEAAVTENDRELKALKTKLCRALIILKSLGGFMVFGWLVFIALGGYVLFGTELIDLISLLVADKVGHDVLRKVTFATYGLAILFGIVGLIAGVWQIKVLK